MSLAAVGAPLARFANPAGTDVLLIDADGSRHAIKPDDGRLAGLPIAPFPQTPPKPSGTRKWQAGAAALPS